MPNQAADEYRPHLCAFVDILGFSEWVRSISATPEKLRQLLPVLQELKARTITKRHDDDKVCHHDRKITAFSDSIVISYPVFGPNPTQSICMDLIWLARRLLEQGFLTRGAVAAGNLYHRDGIVFGDAFLEAYRLEREIAIHPRIIVQDEVLEAGKWLKDAPVFHSQLGDVDEPMSCDRDSDGIRFLNPLKTGFWSVDFLTSPAAFLRTVREVILKQYREAEQKRQSSALVKLAWMANHFNEALAQTKRHQGGVRKGLNTSNSPEPKSDNDTCDINEIEWQRWTLLPLSENAELTRRMFGKRSCEPRKSA